MHQDWKIRASQQPTKKNTTWKKLVIALLLIASLILIYIWTGPSISYDEKLTADFYETNPTNDYLIYNARCKMPAFSPRETEARLPHYKEAYVPCSNKPLLTSVKKNETHVVLSINQDARARYSTQDITCCFSYVERSNGDEPDDHINVSNCTYFKEEVILTKNVVSVRCNVKNKEIYWNVHAFSLPAGKTTRYGKKPSVLLIGIDSISRLNMQRELANTHDYLEANGWIGYVGYNKIDLNTFPNVMAILAGLDEVAVLEKCDPATNYLDNCRFLWDDLKRLGFVTAFGEDCARVNTFNYLKKGFAKQPTDVYFRPYALAINEFPPSQLGAYCAGPEVQGERIFNLIKDFTSTFKNRSSFGFFWTSSFSHDVSTMPGRMDDKIVRLLEHLEREGILDDSFVVFLSDHGIRYSGSRLTKSGWYEERLPFIYFWLPRWFRRRYPKETENLKKNGKKLTTPFDLHVTLQHLLVLSGLDYTMKQSTSCPNSKSLFWDIDEVRSCEDACVPEKWCACVDYRPYDAKSSLSSAAANFALEYLHNTLLAEREEYDKCHRLTLRKVIHASVAKIDGSRARKFLVMFDTSPYTILEAVLELELRDGVPVFSTSHFPSRVNAIEDTADCTSDVVLGTLCYCKEISI